MPIGKFWAMGLGGLGPAAWRQTDAWVRDGQAGSRKRLAGWSVWNVRGRWRGPEIMLDDRGRTNLARVRTHNHDRYTVEEYPDGTLVLTPAVTISVLELAALRDDTVRHAIQQAKTGDRNTLRPVDGRRNNGPTHDVALLMGKALGQESGLCSDPDGDGVAGYPDPG